MSGREGAYPAPPYWPERLTGERSALSTADTLFALRETDMCLHTYIADGWPGPCVTEWIGDRFIDWHPCLTIERAERFAA